MNAIEPGDGMRRILIFFGAVLLLAGVAWPLLKRLRLGHLPGDIHVDRNGFHFYFPLVTCLAISAVASLLLWLLRR